MTRAGPEPFAARGLRGQSQDTVSSEAGPAFAACRVPTGFKQQGQARPWGCVSAVQVIMLPAPDGDCGLEGGHACTTRGSRYTISRPLPALLDSRTSLALVQLKNSHIYRDKNSSFMDGRVEALKLDL